MRVFTPDDGFQYFFGYYDLQPFDSSERFHLMHRVRFMDRRPTADDTAEDARPSQYSAFFFLRSRISDIFIL